MARTAQAPPEVGTERRPRRPPSLLRWLLLALFVFADGQQVWDQHWAILGWLLLFTGLLLPNAKRLPPQSKHGYEMGIAVVLLALALEVLVRLTV